MKTPKPKPLAPVAPPVSMRSSDIIDMERETMLKERQRKGIGATVLAGSYKPGSQATTTVGQRTLLGSAGV